RAHWPLLRDSVELLKERQTSWTFSLIISPALAPATQQALRDAALSANIGAVSDAGRHLAEHDLALACSGTATLECALAGCPPVIFFRASKYAERALRRLLRVPRVGLPNLLLERRAFPELVGAAATAAGLTAATIALAQNLGQGSRDCSAVL